MAVSITGVVLAGGLGRRMGGVDKGLQLLAGQPMVARVVERLAPQVEALIINANRNVECYATLGYPVVPDAIGGFAGPLAGLHVALSVAQTQLVVTAPCDSPFLPSDLVARLRTGMLEAEANVAVAMTGTQTHPVFCLCECGVLTDLTAYLNSGERRFEAWLARQRTVRVAFDDQPAAFDNINTREELARY